MTEPAYAGDGLTVYGGDCRAILAELPAESVHCVVTSPPYCGLRDYGTASWIGGELEHEHKATKSGSTHVRSGDCACGAQRIDAQLGLEPTVDAYVTDLVAIFREVRRVLRPEGTAWLNVGDSYVGGRPSSYRGDSRSLGDVAGPERGTSGLKPKDLVGVPWRVAFALQADGWYLRSDIVWSKPNAMPESVTDRPTRSHEYVFLLAKQSRYYFDAVAVREPGAGRDHPRRNLEVASLEPSGGLRKPNTGIYTADGRNGVGRNIRSVWTIATQSYPGAHYAVFPRQLVEPCVRAGTSERGVCPDCGAPWVRVVDHPALEAERERDVGGRGDGYTRLLGGEKAWSTARPPETIGWQPSCSHGRQAGDWDVIRSPVGAGMGPDYHADTHGGRGTGRRGLDRQRRDDEGTRPMYRWHQRAYARQLRESPFRASMQDEAGGRDAFAHYTRTDPAGARAIPPKLLARWTANGWLREPEELVRPTSPLEPAVVLDPFAGSGTTGLVARELGRRAILIDLNPDYVRQAIVRGSAGYADPGGHQVPADSLWAGVE
ncbi:MAG: site-specific DNA-methyltransferase [Chloroflexi bacterium]|nr:site-specific DNA-methyltransferase [Chloroflexota bacterium]